MLKCNSQKPPFIQFSCLFSEAKFFRLSYMEDKSRVVWLCWNLTLQVYSHKSCSKQLFLCTQHLFLLSLCPSQATDGDQHPLLDRAAPERPPAVARQGAHTNGLPQHPLLQRLLGKPFIHPLPVHHVSVTKNTQTACRQERLHEYGKMMSPPPHSANPQSVTLSFLPTSCP